MDIPELLKSKGFPVVLTLSGADCRLDAPTLLIAAMPYEAEASPATDGAWIHPYYPVSQRAYQAAVELARTVPGLKLRDDIRVKPIFARLPLMTRGLNTLSYLPDIGSRFHVQVFTYDLPLAPSCALTPEPLPLHCGDCQRCMEVCPGGAIQPDGFHRERCLRNWQLSGQAVPEALRPLMGNRLIGCDDCQRCCPHNPRPAAEAAAPVPLKELLERPSETSRALGVLIGRNLARPARVLAQACILAGNSINLSLLPALEALKKHSSPVVAESASWAAERLQSAGKSD
ncbi:MAG: hypothetical protein IKP40_04140 [Clostridia bacterium]|nr:hypothetical protein [Clostridia bacterium]